MRCVAKAALDTGDKEKTQGQCRRRSRLSGKPGFINTSLPYTVRAQRRQEQGAGDHRARPDCSVGGGQSHPCWDLGGLVDVSQAGAGERHVRE